MQYITLFLFSSFAFFNSDVGLRFSFWEVNLLVIVLTCEVHTWMVRLCETVSDFWLIF